MAECCKLRAWMKEFYAHRTEDRMAGAGEESAVSVQRSAIRRGFEKF